MAGATIDYDKLASQHGGTPDYDSLAAAHGGAAESHPVLDAMGEFWNKLAIAHPIEAVKSVAGAVAHPLDTFASISHQTGDLARKAQESYRQGDYGGAAAHAFNAALNVIPGLGAAIDEAATKGANGDWGGMIADTGALAANLATPKLLGKAGSIAKEIPGSIGTAARAVATHDLAPTPAEGVTAVVSPHAAVAHYASRQLGRLMEQLKVAPKEPPVAATEAAPAAEPSRIVIPEEQASVPRSPERQAIVDELNKQPGKVAQPSNTITTPEAAENTPAISAREAVNRSKLAQDLAEFLHSNGEGISHEDALRMGPDQWKLARSAVRQTGKATTPSPATVQLALEHLKELEAKAGTPAKVVPISGPTGPQMLQGKSLDIAQRLAQEMAQ